MRRIIAVVVCVAVGALVMGRSADKAPTLEVGFGEADITPDVKKNPVYLAGFGQNRKATGVHDPLMARAVVLKDDKAKIAIVSIDVVGFFHEDVLKVREQLKGFDHVLVTSTHNHEGPDTLGLWGPNGLQSGVDAEYMKLVRGQIVKAVEQADGTRKPVSAKVGTATAPELLHDGREPYVKHDELVAVEFRRDKADKPAGVVVQWNCHPETLAEKNTLISADYVGATVEYLRKKYDCPVVYLTGTVGGLMTSLKVEVKDDDGKALADGTWEKTERYGRKVGELAEKAIKGAKPATLTPLVAKSRFIYLPIDNKVYRAANQLKVMTRDAYVWNKDVYKAAPMGKDDADKPMAIRTEIAWLRLGELDVAAIPGEIYPELVLGKVQDPADKAADFPDAPAEPSIYGQLKGPYKMIIGLANDEVGYILPKRQWDAEPPFCYGRKKMQYGEINSLGVETGPLLCGAFKDLVGGK